MSVAELNGISSDLKQLASDVLAKAMKAGASDAEAVVYEGDEFGALVRLGQVETLKESGSRAVGLRVFMGQRTASTSSSDFSAESIQRLVDGAVTLAKITRRGAARRRRWRTTRASRTRVAATSIRRRRTRF
jgi:predicted Zn-dependent protease